MEALTRAAAVAERSRPWRVLSSLCLIALVSMATSDLAAQGKLHEDEPAAAFALKQGEKKAVFMLCIYSCQKWCSDVTGALTHF